MLIEIPGNISLNIETGRARNIKSIPLIFLHGFTGSSAEWTGFFESLPAKVFPVAVDLPGHGQSSSPEDVSLYTSEAITNQLNELFKKLGLSRAILAGYSMGGRAALSYAVKYPECVSGLFLESSTAGIKEEAERSERREGDENLAKFIENNSMEVFVDYWMNIPLFASQKKLKADVLESVKKIKLNNNKTGLANSLRGFSTGRMPQLWDSLGSIKVRTLLLTGSLDTKFSGINKIMQTAIAFSEHVTAGQAGHNIHLERPEVFLNLLNGFLRNF